MKEHDFLIVGAGLFGATFAYQAKQQGMRCLVIDRRTWRSGRTLTAVRLIYPGESHKLVARFRGG